ncbi:MCE family protein [Gordonia rhizosphera]|uniref:Mce family protein n=1 Tax=Gordonia rhizosphera NBRC 16068 TaxID=1108045 RepID=K6VRR1_9ACTN|nr:MCE family protein [Gordonia rhizosphera]GAB89615.1 Mce family protein [Gordonia rhizosphera NBRC 16068]
MTRSLWSDTWKFTTFAVVMVLVGAGLLLVFSDSRSGDTDQYRAVFTDVSGLRSGDSVRIAGVRVGSVDDVELGDDNRVRVDFDVDKAVGLRTGTGAAVRYLNLVGDRYLELTEGKGVGTMWPGTEIPVTDTTPALDLDVLLGGLKPVIDGLEPHQVNTLSSAVLDILQGQRSTVQTLFAGSSSLFTALGKNVGVIGQMIDELKKVMVTLNADGARFGDMIERLDTLITDLSRQRDPIGAAITALDNGTASVADLLTQATPSLSGSIDQLSRLAPALDSDKPALDNALKRAPGNFRKLVRTGAYGNFVQYYLCAITVRVSDPTGRVVVLPWIEQTDGRCSR